MMKLTFKILGGGVRHQIIDSPNPREAFSRGLGLAKYGETLLSAERVIVPSGFFRGSGN